APPAGWLGAFSCAAIAPVRVRPPTRTRLAPTRSRRPWTPTPVRYASRGRQGRRRRALRLAAATLESRPAGRYPPTRQASRLVASRLASCAPECTCTDARRSFSDRLLARLLPPAKQGTARPTP